MSIDAHFTPFAAKMRREALPELIVENFRRVYEQLLEGATGLIPAADALPVEGLHDYTELSPAFDAVGREMLRRTVVCKLNGGLGTSMGLSGPKSLVPVKDG